MFGGLQHLNVDGAEVAEGVVEADGEGLADEEFERALEVELLVEGFDVEVFQQAHDVVHGLVFEAEAVAGVDGFFDDGGVVDGVAGSGLVGVGQAAGTEEDATEVAYDNNQCVSQVGREELSVDGAAAGTGGFSVVVGAEGVLAWAEDVGVAVVAGVEVVLTQLVEVHLHLVEGADGVGKGEELGAFLLVEPFAGAR